MEIIENEPYVNGPGGNGQHTLKVYHIGKHIPGESILTKFSYLSDFLYSL